MEWFMVLDRKDVALVNALRQNASQRLEDLARTVRLAPSSVHDRLRRLQRDGVIKKWTVDVDFSTLDLGVLAYVGIRSTRPCSDMLDALKAISCIEECHSVAGELSMLLKVRVADTGALLELAEDLRRIPGIEQTETTIVLKTQLERVVPAKSRPR
jgi:Lrp/AsnC family leucine-responsive transcriptional regulator